MNLTRLSVERPLTILMVILGIVLMGAVAYTRLRVDRLPPIDIPFLGINVTYPQASAQDVEQLIAQPIENVVSGMEGVSSISSNSREGRASVTIQFASGVNIDSAALDVGRRLASIRGRLPADISEPSIFKADPNATPILNIALSGAALEQLFDLASTRLQPQIQSVPGVASVNISGGLQREIQIQVDYSKLAAYGLTIQQLSTALVAANVTAPVGAIDQITKSLGVRSVGAFESVDAIKRLVVLNTAAAGQVRLSDVATITEAYKDQTQLQRMNGTNAVGLSIVKQSGVNQLQVAADVKAKLDDLRKILPPSTKLQITNDNSLFTRASLDAIQRDLILAVFLVGAVMLVFLHQWRNTAIVLFAIPTVLISTFLVMFMLGFTLNIMTLMALALMIGILVDDSIVVLENIHRHLELGVEPREAALRGRSEIGLAAIAITLADVIVYAPMAFVEGTVGQLFRQYGLTIVVATLLSLLISFTLTPMVASRWLHHDTEARGPLAAFGRWWDRGFARLASMLARSMPLIISSRWVVVTLAGALLVSCWAMLSLGYIGTEYAPAEDDGTLRVSLSMPSGTSLTTTDTAARQLEAALRDRVPEIQNMFTTVSSSGFGGGGGSANIALDLGPKDNRPRSAFAIADTVREIGKTIPGATVSANISSPLSGPGGGGTTSLAVDIQGPEIDTLTQLATQVQAAGATVRGLTPLQGNSQASSAELHVRLDPARMAQLGVTSQSAAQVLRTTLSGSTVSVLRRPDQTQVDITIIGSPEDRANLSNALAVPIAGSAANATTSTVVTLGQVATIVPGSGPVQIQRTDRNRTISVRGTANGRPLGQVATDLRAAIAAMELPPGYKATVGGGAQQLNTAIASLTQALVLAVVLEYMLLVALYQSWFYPLVRMAAVPLGLFGAFVGLLVTGNTLNIFSIIGLVMAEGLVAKTSILLIDYTNQLREQGIPRTEALAEASRTRLRPILMTSATMVFGMIPLALKLEAGAESRAPIAIVVIGALISSTFLTLAVVPALYTLFDDLQVWLGRLTSGRQREAVAAAGAPLERARDAAAPSAAAVERFGK
ncbi:MAG: efflux RND transporter permease subunit [Dehalococcoidia bacterium]|nr:efflux RND transporter permease subunit [Dehalococcoidia bacterium]